MLDAGAADAKTKNSMVKGDVPKPVPAKTLLVTAPPESSAILPSAQPGDGDGEYVRDAVMEEDAEDDTVTDGVAVSVELQLRDAPNEPVDVPVTVTDAELAPDDDGEKDGETELRGDGHKVKGDSALNAGVVPPPATSVTPLPVPSSRKLVERALDSNSTVWPLLIAPTFKPPTPCTRLSGAVGRAKPPVYTTFPLTMRTLLT